MDEVGLLRKLVEIPSVSGNEKEAVEFLVEQMKEMGFDEAFVDEVGNAVGIIGAGDRDVMFVGHIDTVPGEIPVRIERRVESEESKANRQKTGSPMTRSLP